ncbi:MAG: hypothetical protein CM15mP31_1450 [Gammaproteobacteria bacterium]|nr:MAG: hypothetical protein CM15mP31_1450 [Gammaproteobacteria bacterium]
MNTSIKNLLKQTKPCLLLFLNRVKQQIHLSSLKFAKKTGNPLSLAICNVANSSICRESDFTLLTNAGPEIGVASTKAFVTQLSALNLLLLTLMKVHNRLPGSRKRITKALLELPGHLEKTLKQADVYKKVAKKFFKKTGPFFGGVFFSQMQEKGENFFKKT